MQLFNSTASRLVSGLAASVLLMASYASPAQTVNLTAAPTGTTLPDGQYVPMWGYQCGAADTSSTPATCTAANPNAGGNWSPVVITVPYNATGATTLKINLTNSLSFAAGTNTLPTSLMIVGQLGGGLELPPGAGNHTTSTSPAHAGTNVTWPTASLSVSTITVTNGGTGYTAPTVTVGGTGGATAMATVSGGVITGITVTNQGAGYPSPPSVTISDSTGTGATAVASVTAVANAGNPGSTPPAQLPRVQSFGTEVAAGATATLTWSNLRPGTYLIESGTHPSIQAPMGLYGILVVTSPVNSTTAGQAYPTILGTDTASKAMAMAAAYDADVPAVLSEIDPVQNAAVDAAVKTAGFLETNVWSGQTGGCGDPKSASFNTCYPPAVNYSPRYYLVNGVSFDRTNIAASSATASVLSTAPTFSPLTGNVIVRLVNAGLRMHVPSIVGAPMTLIAEDGNPLPGMPRQQNEVFLAAGKTYDVAIQPAQATGAYTDASYPLYDRQLSLSTNNQRDGGMQTYIAVGKGAQSGVGAAVSSGTALGGAPTLKFVCVTGRTLTISDPQRGLLGGTTGANGVALASSSLPTGSTLALQANGTFTYTPPATGTCAGSFTFVVNNNVANHFTASIAECDASTGSNTSAGCTVTGGPTLADDSFKSNNAQQMSISPPGVLLNDWDPAGLPLTVDLSTVPMASSVGLSSLTVNADGSFSAVAPGPGTYTFTYNVKNSQQTPGSKPVPGNPPTTQNFATVTLNFPSGSGLKVHLLDKNHGWELKPDYRWVIEEDRTFWIDPKCQVNTGTGPRPKDSYGRDCPAIPVEALGYNFHSAGMPVVATGCLGTLSCEGGQSIAGSPVVCDAGDGVCRPDTTGNGRTPLDPGMVALDPNKHYFISVMPGDGINPTLAGAGGPVTDPVTNKTRQFDPLIDCKTQGDFDPGVGACGHNMGGTQIGPQFDAGHNSIPPVATMTLAETPLPTAKISVLVYEDDYPLNGENDAGGGVDILAPNEPGLGGFQIELLDQAGALGDSTGQITYDMFNMPLSNSLAGTRDPISGLDACPLTANPDHMVAMVITCPTYESDNKTLSPLAGQAVIANLYPGIYEPQAFPAADRIARGEEWLQTNTLDGGKPHEAFVRPGEPAYFQEFGPGGFHVQIGFANPKTINDRRTNSAGTGLCDPLPNGGGLVCNSSVTGHVHGNHMSRTPDERTYDTETYDAFKFSNCYASLGIPDQQDFAFAKCDADGNFTITGLPDGTYKLAVFDQWNDIMLDGLVTAVAVNGDTPVTVTATQWRTNLYTRTYLDLDGNGIPNRTAGNDTEAGAPLIPIRIRYRDGSIGFSNTTDLNGYATYNEVFPFMNWLVVEPDTTRYKQTGQHVVYDAGGPDDCTTSAPACSSTAANLASTTEYNSLPTALKVPGAMYCSDADCSLPGDSIKNSPYYGGTSTGLGGSSGRIDPPWRTEAWQGLLGQHSFIDFGMKPFLPGETGGIQGLVVYSSTRPFDDPGLLIQLTWEPAVPNVQVNLYKEDVAADGTKTLTLVDTTTTTSWDAWAQGFRTNGDGKTPLRASDIDPTVALGSTADGLVPNMNCPGQDPKSGFFATLAGSKMWLDSPAVYDANGHITNAKNPLAYNSQFKCFDGWSMLNQIQPGPYDGKYQFPSIVDRNPKTGKPSGVGSLNGQPTALAGTNCSICTANTVDPTDPNPVLPAGKYVVEVVTPQGYEIVKEEDKNILMGDIYVAPVTQQFAGLGSVFILPDQAAMNAYYNASNPLNPTNNLGVVNPREDFASTDQMWPCVGQTRIVPDTMSLFPAVGQTAPFAGAARPLCDRKEVTLHDQETASAKFYVFTKNHIAGHFVGGMTNDMASEFDPFSPQFGEKFGVPNLPIRMRDFVGDEVTRVYGDQWGAYNGMYFSSWEVNPPNPTGYAPQMSVACMNDPGPILDTDPASATHGQMITDPSYNPAYANFCYETPFMPGFTAYMDTPVTPTQAFADHYNLPDSEYPDNTPVIKRADFQGNTGPWAAGSASVSSVSVTRSGSLYSGVPTVSFSGGGGTGASANATMLVNAVAITSASGYTSAPAVSFTGGGGGSGAAATACVGISSITVSAGGTGYTSRPTVTLSGGGAPNGTRATNVRATVAGGKVTQVTFQDGGCGYTSAPTVTFTGGGGTGAAATAALNLISVNVTNHGSGYSAVPTVVFSAGNAQATATLAVNTVVLTAGGSGYTSAPTVAFTGGGGSGAAATDAIGGVSASVPLILQSVGARVVQNPQFAGPSAVAAPYNNKTVTRFYDFGSQCTAIGGACVAISSVTVGGLPATVNTWNKDTINLTVPSGLASCPIQQQNAPSPAVCGEVVVTAGNGKQTIDGITVTIGGKAPTIVTPSSQSKNNWGEFYPNPLQTAIDNATPGDLIIVEAGSYRENLIMWKPVRLQGVGAALVTINADAQPAGKMDAWRRRVSCLFGLTIDGAPLAASSLSAYDPNGQYSCPKEMYFRADRIPFEGFVGWDASSNGNLAQVLQEPSLMGAYEGAAVTVVGRGVNQVGSGEQDLWGQSVGGGAFADGSRYLNANVGVKGDCSTATTSATVDDYGTGNFQCNPSSIDGFSIINSSQGGGGIFMHGWNHNMQIANNRISANAGTLSGGINLGNGETSPAFMLDNTICFANPQQAPNPAPLCPPVPRNLQIPVNGQIPFQFNTNVHIHHNQIIDNASIGDALFSGTPAGAGGVTISAGSDFYKLDHNWIAANLTSSDGGGIAQMGVSFDGNISNNFVLFNQANNPTLPVDGGGIIIMGAQEDRTLATGVECGGVTDLDCPPGMSDGTGPGLVIDSNLILGNSAEDGSGGGLRLRQTNGTEMVTFESEPSQWYGLTVTNNIIVNNVAGWDGGGVSLQDSFKTQFVNNTVASNDTTASAGVLFKTLGAIDAASPPPGCLPTPDPTQPQSPNCLLTNGPHIPQPAGLVTMQNTPNLMAQLKGTVTCPAGYGYGGAGDNNQNDNSLKNGRCILVSLPKIVNDLFWQNRAFSVEIVDSTGQVVQNPSTPTGTGLHDHQNIVALVPILNQSYTGQCANPPFLLPSGAATQLYWDLGVRMDGLPDTSGHNLVFNNATVGSGYTLEAAAVATVDPVTAIAVSQGGTGYTSAPAVTISGGGGSGATAIATVSAGVVTKVTVTNGGNLYTSAPTVTFSGGGGTGATATASITASQGQVLAYTVFNPGAGYTSAPTVTVDPPAGCTLGTVGCTQATAAAHITGGVVTAVTPVNKGAGYTTLPNITFTGGGITVNGSDQGPVALTAKNSILSDQVNLLNINSVAGSPNLLGSAGAKPVPVQGQYCNGARIPPEQCSTNQGANDPGMCAGYFTPAGQSETFGVAPVFTFNGIKASATVDEGNNWINMTYGPLSLGRPVAGNGSFNAEPIVASAPVAAAGGAYTIVEGSAAIDAGADVSGITQHDFFGQPRSQGSATDIGAVELAPVAIDLAITKAASTASVAQGGTVQYTVTVSNLTTAVSVVGAKVVDTLPAGVTATWTCAAGTGSSCVASATGSIAGVNGLVNLAAGGSVTFTINATMGNTGNVVNTATVTAPAGYAESVTSNNAASAAVSVTAVPHVAPTTLTFTGVLQGTTSAVQNVTLTNSSGAGLTNIAVAVTAPFARSGGTCGTTLAAQTTCTVGVVYAPGTGVTSSSGTLAISANVAIVGSPVALSGTAIAAVRTATLTPSLFTYTARTRNCPGTGLGVLACLGDQTHGFTLTNTGNVPLTGITPSITGTNTADFVYRPLVSNCGATLAAGASCTLTVQFQPQTSESAGTKTANLSVADSATGTPQVSVLSGGAN